MKDLKTLVIRKIKGKWTTATLTPLTKAESKALNLDNEELNENLDGLTDLSSKDLEQLNDPNNELNRFYDAIIEALESM